MIALIRRVTRASVTVDNFCLASIRQGLLVLLGISKGDGEPDVQFMVDKIPRLRIFSDPQGRMNHSLQDIEGELLLVSQFTLLANTTKGRRPSFEYAAPPELAQPLYQSLLEQLQSLGIMIQSGRFGASMNVSLENDGPVTLILDSRSKEGGEKG